MELRSPAMPALVAGIRVFFGAWWLYGGD